MDFISLARRLVIEAGVSGSGPASVLNQTGEMLRIVGWIKSAYDDIQLHNEDWFWMRAEFSFTATAEKFRYTALEAGVTSRFGAWNDTSFAIKSVGQNDVIPLDFISYSQYRESYISNVSVASRPVVFSVAPTLEILLGDRPNKDYLITGEYFKSPQILVNNVDIPDMPAQYHLAIVYRALMMYARYEAASEIYQDAEANYVRFLRKLELGQMPMVDMQGAMV